MNDKWISVKDRLPERHVDVLIYTTDLGGIMRVDYVSDGRYWHLHDGVTHWMPLPEPPEEEEV